ncbi:MAG: IS4 family transposase [Verrucomicrobiota bacterium]
MTSSSRPTVRPKPGAIPVLPSKLNALARITGFLKRQAKKLTPAVFIQAVLVCAASGRCTFRDLATEIGILTGFTYSRQALWERIGSASVDFLKGAVALALKENAKSIPSLKLKNLPNVTRILIGDSSVFTLHPRLYQDFPGGSNHIEGQHSAQCRFQLVFDLITGKWLQTKLDPYARNDRAAAWDIVDHVIEQGDLIIRDLGYAVTGCLQAIADKGAYFLSRLNTVAAVLDETNQRIDLLALARSKAPNAGDSCSAWVKLSKTEQLSCRLILINEGEEVGNTRRRRLNRDSKRRGSSHTKDYLALQNWTLLVSNLGEESANETQFKELYRIRWRIENIFKLAKSQTSLAKMAAHHSNRHHVELMIWGWILFMIGLTQRGVFAIATLNPLPKSDNGDQFFEARGTDQSIFKAIAKIIEWTRLQIELTAVGSIEELTRRLEEQCRYHDRYDKREDRISLPRRFELALTGEYTLP